jgi:CysZ protein
LLIAFLLTIPIVNLVAPVVGTAAMVHLFETIRHEA